MSKGGSGTPDQPGADSREHPQNSNFTQGIQIPQGIPISPQGIPISPQGIPISPQGIPISPQGIPISPQGIPISPQGIPISPQGIPRLGTVWTQKSHQQAGTQQQEQNSPGSPGLALAQLSLE
uniref:Uncharacterized protein n=1 Tax=Catharus ustulatus TaxID=91951 RepID=A0A8C3V2U9_CATUS